MKKMYLLRIALCSLVIFMWACSSDEFYEAKTNAKQITMTASDFEFADGSRTSIKIGPDGGGFSWSSNDTVGIFPNEGGQVYFPMISGAGTNSAIFNGGGWSLKPSSTYAAYYPYNFYNRDPKVIPVSFEGQTQIGNASTAHLGKYDFMAAKAITPNKGNVCFKFQHLCSLVELNITLPNKASLASVTLSVDSPVFITRGLIDLTSLELSIKAESLSRAISINLDYLSPIESNVYKVYFMMVPSDLTDKFITVTALDEYAEYRGITQMNKMLPGKAYSVTASLPEINKDLWVDLGLSVKWASHNIGAGRADQYGDYFAWGEINPKEGYYYWNSLTDGKEMKNSIAGNPKYDAARANWGAPAKMPTETEFNELLYNCEWKWTIFNGIRGYMVTSKINSNSIFLPACGYKSETQLNDVGEWGHYWSATPQGGDNVHSFNFNFCNDRFNHFSGLRMLGECIRPVAQ